MKCRFVFLLLAATLPLFAHEEYRFAGRHFLASYLDCDPQAISDSKGMEEAMDNAVRLSGATILSHDAFFFDPSGVTIVYLLSESHASIHTYPEHRACFVDLFTCGDRCSSERFDAKLREYLQPKQVSAKVFLRSEQFDEKAFVNLTQE